MDTVHISVLLKECIEGLNLKSGALVLDGTFGGGGHSMAMCESVKDLKIIALDQDNDALERGREKFKKAPCDISFVHLNFRDMDKAGVEAESVDGILLDLGLSSDQLENSLRGFSFQKDEPLLMTMKENPSEEILTAGDVVNSWSEANLADIIYGYGEERYARRIAKGIVDARQKKDIKTTFDLVEIIRASVPNSYNKGRIHPATKTFQAIRIAVNDELNTLEVGLKKGFDLLKKEGRIAVITFHSLEDRIVKKFFKAQVELGEGKLLYKKPLGPSVQEVKENPRSRSAKLRILEKII
jgi:16S rRNA (cytosine1402-N4)-methyltransferase